jgi:SAM-dependent methyltransferase
MSQASEASFVLYDGLRLPPPQYRWGGGRYRDDARYVNAARHNIRTIQQLCGLTQESRLLDVGSGPGRLLTGALAEMGSLREYLGLDVNRTVVEWARAALGDPGAGISFEWLNLKNERYNRNGQEIGDGRLFPVDDAGYDVVALISVFSHMRLADITAYLAELARVLAPGGRVYLSLFVEYGVPPEEENPPGYHREWSGPLHCVRIDRRVFEDHVHDSGLVAHYFRYRHTNDGQSTYVLGRRDDPDFKASVVS